MTFDSTEQAVLITCKHEAILLVQWLKKGEARAVCTSVNAYLLLCAEGLRNRLELMDSPLPGNKFSEIVVTAERLARTVDTEISQHLTKVAGQPMAQGWDFWDKLLFAKSLLPIMEWLRTVDLRLLPDRLAVCQFANAQDYFHPSSIRSEIFCEAFKRVGKRLTRIPIEFPLPLPHTAGVWRSIYRASGKHLMGARLVHVPSAFYKVKELAQVYAKEGFLGLESPYYENRVTNKNILLDRKNVANSAWPMDMDVPRCIYGDFAEQLGLSGLRGIQLQLDHWLERLAFQFRAFKMLSILRDKYGVSLAALSDHDGGLFGPACSAFRDQKEVVALLPHSTICVGPLPRLASDAIGVMQSVRPLEPFDGAPLPAPTLVQGPPQACNVDGAFVIVLNEIDDVSGLPAHKLDDLLDFVEALASGLITRGLRPVLRARSSAPVQAVRRLKFEAWDGDLGELVTTAALCIGVGRVTSALTHFWCAGVPCLHVQDRELDPHGSYLLPAKGVECFVGRPFMEALPQVLGFVDGLVVSA